MLVSTGFFDDKGSPSLNLALRGVVGDKQDFTAIIDTGFSGFVAMSVMQAFPLGLPLFGTTTVTLADGKNQAKLIAQAEATLGDRSAVGLVILEFGNSDVLIGMDFLRRLGLALFVTSAAISLYGET